MVASYVQSLTLRHAPSAVLFDWDNTLFDHDKHLAYLSESLIRAIGREPYPTPDEMNALWHKDAELCCKTYFPGYTPDQVLKEWKGFQEKISQETNEMLPGALDVLENLKARNIPMIIVSNKPEALLRKELEHFGLTEYFEAIVGGHNEKKYRKPSFYPIEQALKIANEARLEKGEAKLALGNMWLVGDEAADAGAGRACGIQRFIVGHKHRELVQLHHEDNDPAGGIIYLDAIADFNHIIRALPSAQLNR